MILHQVRAPRHSIPLWKSFMFSVVRVFSRPNLPSTRSCLLLKASSVGVLECAHQSQKRGRRKILFYWGEIVLVCAPINCHPIPTRAS